MADGLTQRAVALRDPLLPAEDGHTPLDEDDLVGLKLSYITTRGELNEAEQENILRAMTERHPPDVDALLSDRYLRALHHAMFGDVWSWAGVYRLRETSIGIDPVQIATAVRNLVRDARAWIDVAAEPEDVIGVRFGHRLVSIHPFRNGNGRHSRLAADHLARALGRPPFTWGAGLAVSTAELRTLYLGAVRQADAGKLDELVTFARN